MLACGLILNLYCLTVRRGEGLAQVVRFIRVLILVLLLAGVMQLTGRLEEISMLPLWGLDSSSKRLSQLSSVLGSSDSLLI